MSKKHKNNGHAQASEPETEQQEEQEEETEEQAAAEPEKPLDKAALSKLIERYTRADDILIAARAEVEKKQASRSEVAKAIHDMIGNKKFPYRGSVVSVVHKGTSYFFRGPKSEDVLTLD